MIKSNNNLNGNYSKLTISKDKFSDENFDKLVIDTSRKVTRRNLTSDSKTNQVAPESNNRPKVASNPAATATTTTTTASLAGSIEYNRLNQPKRPMNAFMVWGQAIRRELHLEFSNVQNALLSKALGRVWRSLDLTDKEPYIDKANLIKANHKREYPNYRYQPRRIHENRKSKSNMLIGINLNHPVNQQLRPNSNNFEIQSSRNIDSNKLNRTATLTKTTSSFLETTTTFAYNTCDRDYNCNSQASSGKQMKEIDGVQKIEYQPYAISLHQPNNLNFTSNGDMKCNPQTSSYNSSSTNGFKCTNYHGMLTSASELQQQQAEMVDNSSAYVYLDQPQYASAYDPRQTQIACAASYQQQVPNFHHCNQAHVASANYSVENNFDQRKSITQPNYYGMEDNGAAVPDCRPNKIYGIQMEYHSNSYGDTNLT